MIWSALSSWYYVCHVRDFCGEPDLTSQAPPEVVEPAADTIPVVEEVIPLPEAVVVQYGYNSDQIKPNDALNNFLAECKTYLEKKPEAVVIITGHTCSIGASAYNMELGLKRAGSAGSWLTDNGIPGNKIQTLSEGEDSPVADNSTESGREKNRRSEITVKN